MSRDRRNDILLKAARVFLECGYDGTSMNLVAERSDVTKPGLYYHFDGKQALLFAIMSYAMDELEAETAEALATATDPVERLRSIVETHARMICTRPEGTFSLLVIDATQSLREAERETMQARKRAYVEQLQRTLDEVRASGRLRDLDSTVSAFTLLGMLLWASRWFEPTGRLSGDEVAAQITEMALAAVLRPATD